MQHLFTSLDRPLPDALRDDLETLLGRDNNSVLTWADRLNVAVADSRWFSVKLNGDGRRFQLQLEFWIPTWMDDRRLNAILPASRPAASCKAGDRAVVALDDCKYSECVRRLPRWALLCARLINQLWGVSAPDEVHLRSVEYQDQLQLTPFPHPEDR